MLTGVTSAQAQPLQQLAPARRRGGEDELGRRAPVRLPCAAAFTTRPATAAADNARRCENGSSLADIAALRSPRRLGALRAPDRSRRPSRPAATGPARRRPAGARWSIRSRARPTSRSTWPRLSCGSRLRELGRRGPADRATAAAGRSPRCRRSRAVRRRHLLPRPAGAAGCRPPPLQVRARRGRDRARWCAGRGRRRSASSTPRRRPTRRHQ